MKTTIPLELVDIEDEGYHFTVEVLLNGVKARLVLDTGASRTVLDSNCIADYVPEPVLKEEERLSAGVGSNQLQSFSIVLKKVEIGGLEIRDYPVAVLDLQHVTASYHHIGKGVVHGVLGGDILLSCNAVIDYKNRTMSLQK